MTTRGSSQAGRPAIPESSGAERSALACALLDPDYATPILLQCKADDFYDINNRRVYDAIASLHTAGQIPDVVTVSDLLAQQGHPELAIYVMETPQYTPNAYHAGEYVRIIRDRAARRRILDGLNTLARQCFSIETSIEAIADTGAALLHDQIGSLGHSGGTVAHDGIASVLNKAQYYLDHPINAWETRGIDTGYRALNVALDGWKRGNVYYVLGLEHSGKTWLALNLTMNLCANGGNVVYFSLEQSTAADDDPQTTTLWERVLLSRANVSAFKFLKGTLDDQKRNAIADAGNQAFNWLLTMHDDKRTLPAIEAAVRATARERRVDLVVIDYLKLIQQTEQYGTRNEEIGGLTSRLKRLALDLNVPILVPHQVGSKSIAGRLNKRIALSDGYESGHISQDADVVLGFNRAELFNPTEQPNIVELDVLKDRVGGGTGGSIDLYFDKRTGRILPVQRTNQPLEPAH